MARLTLGLLGSLQVTLAETHVTSFESDKARALLAYLAVESDCSHRREALLGLLWPECPEEVARRNLRQALYNLRQTIGDQNAHPPFILVTREEIQFNTASDHILDVAAFNALLTATDTHPHAQLEACTTCAARMQQAVELYRGKFLQEFFLKDSAEFEEWAVVQRESLHRRALEALAHLANYHEQSGQYERARSYALLRLDFDPWSEEGHRQLMRTLSKSGQRSAALAQYETCRRVLAKELGIEPSAETRELREQISRGELDLRKDAVPSARAWAPVPLPSPVTLFIGREQELDELAQLLGDPECRLLTLVGPGGIGKTRLALQTAEHIRERFAHGAAFVALAPVESPTLIISSIGEAVGLAFSGPADYKMQLQHYLRDKQMLLVLDNVEHLLDGAGLFVEILERAPKVKLLVTSREQLNLHAEWVFEVGGLQVPGSDQAEGFEQNSAVALFLQRARRARIGFALRPEQRPAVVRICRLLGGMPLAIELAAAWVGTLSPDEIEREIERGLDFLATSMRDLPERHRSMQAVFDHSWRSLSSEERRALAGLSVFRGGFTREAAHAVAGANLHLLSSLFAKSLIRRMPGGRYDLHELVQQYAAAKLEQAQDQAEAAGNRHSTYFTDFVQSRERHLKGARQLQALEEIGAEMENIRMAWRWAVTRCQIASIRKPLKAFWLYYEMRGGFEEARALFGWAAEELEASGAARAERGEANEVLLASVRALQGWFCVKLGDSANARKLLEPTTAKLRSLGATMDLVDAIHYMWGLEFGDGNYARARALALEQLDLAARLGDPWELALANGAVGRAAYVLEEYREALDRLERADAIARDLGDPGMTALCLCYLGPVQLNLGMYAAAQDSLRESARLSRMLGDRWTLAKALTYLGLVVQAQGDLLEAVRLFRESLALFEDMRERWNAVSTLNDLGSAYLGLDAEAEAQEAFFQALGTAREIQLLSGMLEALTGIARWQVKKGQSESALIVLTHILNEPSIARGQRDRAAHLRMEVEPQMPVDQVEAAEAKARAESLETFVQGLLSAKRQRTPLAEASST